MILVQKSELWFPMTDEFAQSEKTFIEPYDEYKFGLPIEGKLQVQF